MAAAAAELLAEDARMTAGADSRPVGRGGGLKQLPGRRSVACCSARGLAQSVRLGGARRVRAQPAGADARRASAARNRHGVGCLPRAQGRLAVHGGGQQGLGCNEERGQEECGSRSKECEGLSQERYLAPKLAQ